MTAQHALAPLLLLSLLGLPALGQSVEAASSPPNSDSQPTAEPEPAETEENGAPPAPLEQALAWAEQGLRAFQAGELESARRHLADARIVLLEAELPAVMQEKGLALLGCCMPPDLARHNLERVATELEQALAPRTADLPERQFVEAEVRRILIRFGSHPSEAELATLLAEVETYLGFYRGHYRDFFARASARKGHYWPLIERVFAEFNLPVELGYMAMVESGFNPRAVSHANARGLWQFITATGRRYGLSQREDFYNAEKSTRAAADYLRDLISIFGPQSFLLAMAGYNAGEGRIMGCLRGVADPMVERSFWEIRPCLMRETREYVPRVLAAAVISSDPRRFGFDPALPVALAEAEVPPPTRPAAEPEAEPRSNSRPTLVYTVKAGNTVESVAALFGVRSRDLASWNRLGSSRLKAGQRLTIHPSRRLVAKSHTVRRGETASAIARRYGVATGQVLTANGLSPRTTIRPGQRLLVYVRA